MLSYMNRGREFYRGLFRLALPLILQNIIMTALTMVDTFMVGVLGEAEMAAVTLANTPTYVMELLIFGFQSGSAVLISQFWGKQDKESINRVIGIGFYVAGVVSALFALWLVLFPVEAMSLFGNNQKLIGIAAEYIRPVGISYFFLSFTAIYIAAHRGMENPKLGLYIYSTGMVVNTFLNWVLIFGNLGAPAMGVEGAAIATLIARIVEFTIMILHANFNKRFRLMPKYFLRPGKLMIKKYIKYASPVIVNETLWGLGTAVYPTIMGHMENSQQILAAYTIAGNVADIMCVAVFAVAGTAAVIIGREIGKGNRDEVYSIGAALTTTAFLVGLGMGILMIVLCYTVIGPYIYPIFNLSEMGAGIATMMMTSYGSVLALRAFNSTNIVGVLRGGGDVKIATLIDVLPLWCVSVPLAAVLGLVLKADITWVYLATLLDTLIKFSFGLSRFRSRKWINDVTAGIESSE